MFDPQKFRLMLAKSGLSNKELAGTIGSDEAAISHYKHGERSPRPERLEKIANALHVTVEELQVDAPPAPVGREAIKARIEEILPQLSELDCAKILSAMLEILHQRGDSRIFPNPHLATDEQNK